MMMFELPTSCGDISSLGFSFSPWIFSAWGSGSNSSLAGFTAPDVGTVADERAGVGRIILELDDVGEAVVVSLLGGVGLDVIVGDGVVGLVACVLSSEVIVIRTVGSSKYPD